jgi:hypothetical protein
MPALGPPLRFQAVSFNRAAEFLPIPVLVVDREIPGRLKFAGFATVGMVLL